MAGVLCVFVVGLGGCGKVMRGSERARRSEMGGARFQKVLFSKHDL